MAFTHFPYPPSPSSRFNLANPALSYIKHSLQLFLELVVQRLFQTPGTELTLVVDNLSPETQYRVAVRAVNDYGISGWSEDVYRETLKTIKARIEPTEDPNSTKEGNTR